MNFAFFWENARFSDCCLFWWMAFDENIIACSYCCSVGWEGKVIESGVMWKSIIIIVNMNNL